MSKTLKPITKAARQRAASADPNSQRCLIENCSRTRAVQIAHVFDRGSPATAHMVEGLEWSWGLMKGTLNLDTRHNMFFLGASMHELYKDLRWTLLPEKDIVYQYYDEEKLRPLRRSRFPKIEAETFRYTFVPLKDMEDIYLTHQDADTAEKRVTVHNYPFEDLPIITSHVHPKFVILHLGQILCLRLSPTKKVLLHKYPWLCDVRDLFIMWTAMVPGGALDIPGYMPPRSVIPESSPPLSESNVDSTCTPPRRIQPLANRDTVHQESKLSPRSDASANSVLESRSGVTTTHCIPVQNARKRSATGVVDGNERRIKKRLLTHRALKEQNKRDDLESVKWVPERILSWARGCPSSSAPPAAPMTAPLRRSARIKSKARKL